MPEISNKTKNSSALVLLSGGIDSTVLLYYVMKVLNYARVEVILFDYGQQHRIEVPYAQRIVENLQIPYEIVEIDLKQFGHSSLTTGDENLSVVVPARNSIFLSLATAYAEVRGLQDIFFGPNREDFKDFPDCREQFVQLISQALSIGNNVRGVYAPFINMSKKDIVQLGRKLGVPFELTWSCYNPTDKNEPCGKCHACTERSEALWVSQKQKVCQKQNWLGRNFPH